MIESKTVQAFQERNDNWSITDPAYLLRASTPDFRGPYYNTTRGNEFVWPDIGYVECTEFSEWGSGPGLYGNLNGSGSFNYLLILAAAFPDQYIVQAIVTNKCELVKDRACQIEDPLAGSYKFRRGFVIASGNFNEVMPFFLRLVRSKIVEDFGEAEYERYLNLDSSVYQIKEYSRMMKL